MGTIVELLGPPGAGKSTLAAALEKQLIHEGRTVAVGTRSIGAGTPGPARLRSKAVHVLAGAITRTAPSLEASLAIAASGQGGVLPAARRAVAWLVAQRLTARARRAPGVTILDEGGLQALWSIGLFGDHRPLLDRWVARPSTWDVGDLVVVLLPSPAQLEARLAGRSDPHSRIERLQGGQRLEAVERGHALTRDIAAALPELGVPAVSTVWVDGRGIRDPDDTAREIAALLRWPDGVRVART